MRIKRFSGQDRPLERLIQPLIVASDMGGGDKDLAPMVGTKADDVLSVDTSVSFSWVPDPGDAFSSGTLYSDYETLSFQLATTTGPSCATGSVTFDVPSSRPFTMGPDLASFRFTSGGAVYSNEIYFGDQWKWNPMTGVLDPAGSGTAWDDVIQITFDARSTHYVASHFPDYMTLQELGHWAMVSDPIEVAVFGSAGNDTIYGGQGQETLSGDAGDDVIYVGRGNDLVFGGSGSDEIHGGMGTQVLDGGAGSDTIWGGSGTQTIMGDGGDDLLIAGAGAETVVGGAGRDTIWGGSGSAYLDGGAGADVLHFGIGNETLVGGAGRDVFAAGSGASGQDVVADFVVGQDVLQVDAEFGGLAIARARDLAAYVSAGNGGAMMSLGGWSVTLAGVSASQVTSHLQQVFKVVWSDDHGLHEVAAAAGILASARHHENVCVVAVIAPIGNLPTSTNAR